jgi:hypothetical protein
MRFSNFGGIHQFVVTGAADLEQIDALDPARWAATSAPLADLHCDEVFLKHVDAEGTGRVRVAQIVRARDWLFERLADREVVKSRSEVIRIDAIKDEKIRTAALRVNREQKTADVSKVALADVRAFKSSYAKFLANGDGVIPPDVVPEAEVGAFIKDVISVVGSVPDRGGSNGIDTPLLERFKTQGRAWLDWKSKEQSAAVWGNDTKAASALCERLDAKLEEYFLHCDLLRQETLSEHTLRLTEDEVRTLRAKDTAAIEAYLKASPIAPLNARGVLDLTATINSLYAADLAELRDTVLKRALGSDVKELSREAWRKVRATFEGWRTYEASKPPEPFESLGEKLTAYLEGPLPERVAHYINLDKAAAPELDEVDNLEKLLLYVRWIVELANNFVNFSAIYRPSETALVEMGSLVIDGRRLDFCIKVRDRSAHKALATDSMIFLVYAKIMEKEDGGERFEVVAPVTGGEKGRLRTGKRGIFYDRNGKEWDAQIVEVVENPISVREAMFAPFRRAAAFLAEKFESWVGSSAESQQQALTARTEQLAASTQQNAERALAEARPPASPAPPATNGERKEGINVNSLVIGGGMALAGLGAMLAGLVNVLTSLSGWAAILGVVVAVLALSAFSAWLKLRRRNVSVLLEANGWAVNVHTRVTARIARVFAYTPDLPKGATLDMTDSLPATDEEGVGSGVFVLFLIVAGAAFAAWAHFYKHWF